MIPVSVITGFLGSGKTTLLKRLLADPRMGETAVLVNEFGEVGLDHLLLRKLDEETILLGSGCLCCTVRSDLVESLAELWAKRASGAIPPFARATIETTGLADPAPILHTLMTDGALTPHFALGTLVATLDSTLGEPELDRHPEAVKQVAMADRLVLTKTDRATPDAQARLQTRLDRLNPTAPRFPASLDAGPAPDALFDQDFSLLGKSPAVRRWLEAEADPAATHEHDGHRHDRRIGTFCLTLDRPVDWARFIAWLQLLLASRGEQLLRVKGLLAVAGRPRPLVIQGVQHVFYPPVELPCWPDDDRRSRLVFITRDLSRAAVETSLRRLVEDA